MPRPTVSMMLAFRKLTQPTFVNRAGPRGYDRATSADSRRISPSPARTKGNEIAAAKVGTRNVSHGVDTESTGKKKKKEKGEEEAVEVERSSTEGYERGCTAPGVSSCRSLMSPVLTPYFFQPHRCTLDTPLSTLAPSAITKLL